MMRPHLEAVHGRVGIVLVKRDIDDDPQWRGLYRLRIPVVEYDGRVILEGRPSEEEVADAVAGLVGLSGGSSPVGEGVL